MLQFSVPAALLGYHLEEDLSLMLTSMYIQMYMSAALHILICKFRIVIQGYQKVSVLLMMYCNRQVHRNVLITLYISVFLPLCGP